jgi:hypothetical protein
MSSESTWVYKGNFANKKRRFKSERGRGMLWLIVRK